MRRGAQFRPPVRRPADRRKLELGGAAFVAVVIVIGEHLAPRRLQRLLAAGADEAARGGGEQGAAALPHVLAVPIEIGAFDAASAADTDVVGRGDAFTALVETDEEIEFLRMLQDRRGLDRAAARARSERDGGRAGITQLAGLRVELAQLDPGPEGAVAEVRAAVRKVDAERVDR